MNEKNPNKFSGIESYVNSQLNRGVFALEWVPIRSSFITQLHGNTATAHKRAYDLDDAFDDDADA